MDTLPHRAQLYLVFVWVVAAALVLAAIEGIAPLSFEPLHLLLLCIYAVADYFEVHFEVRDGDPVVMTVSDAIGLFLVAAIGVSGVLIVILGTALVDGLGRRAWYRIAFNVAQRSITYLAMVAVYQLISEAGSPLAGPRELLAFVAAALTYYLLNTVLLAAVIALASQLPMLGVFIGNLRMAYWVYLMIMPSGAILAVLWKTDHWLVLLGILPLVLAQRSFNALAAWQRENRRNKALAVKLEHLQETATAMIANFEPEPLLATVGARLATLLDACASWVVLLDTNPPRLLAPRGIPPDIELQPAAFAEIIRRQSVQQLEGEEVTTLMPSAAERWSGLVIIPLVVEDRTLGGIFLAVEWPAPLAEDDRRVLRAFAAQAALAMEHARLFIEVRDKQAELMQSSKLAALGTFAAGIAHEFNNLLAAIIGYAQLGLQTDDLAEKNEVLEKAVRSSLRGRSITSGLLTFARRDASQRDLCEVAEVVEDTLALVERELAKANIVIERRIGPVPPTICNAGQIAQVVMNLITNARDAMVEQGGGLISVALAQRGRHIELQVRDEGCGIPESLLSQVFQPFVTTKGAMNGSPTPGTGLGLAIIYGIVESHSGSIDIQSKVGEGTAVTIRLPLVQPEGNGERAPSAAGAPAMRILVVEDDMEAADSLRRLLQGWGHDVQVASSGEAALRAYRHAPADLVIGDVTMAKTAGAEFFERLRAIDPEAQALVVTGQTPTEHVRQMLQARGFAVLTKPFTADELMSAVARQPRADPRRAARPEASP